MSAFKGSGCFQGRNFLPNQPYTFFTLILFIKRVINRTKGGGQGRTGWRIGKPGVLQSMGWQRVGPAWVTEQQQTYNLTICNLSIWKFSVIALVMAYLYDREQLYYAEDFLRETQKNITIHTYNLNWCLLSEAPALLYFITFPTKPLVIFLICYIISFVPPPPLNTHTHTHHTTQWRMLWSTVP